MTILWVGKRVVEIDELSGGSEIFQTYSSDILNNFDSLLKANSLVMRVIKAYPAAWEPEYNSQIFETLYDLLQNGSIWNDSMLSFKMLQHYLLALVDKTKIVPA